MLGEGASLASGPWLGADVEFLVGVVDDNGLVFCRMFGVLV